MRHLLASSIGASHSQERHGRVVGIACVVQGALSERGAMERQRVVVAELRVDTNHTLNPLCWKRRHSVCWKELCRDGVTRLVGRHHWWGFGITLRSKPSAPRRQQGLSLSPSDNWRRGLNFCPRDDAVRGDPYPVKLPKNPRRPITTRSVYRRCPHSYGATACSRRLRLGRKDTLPSWRRGL